VTGVTGATGGIGGRVARRLAERGVRQRLIVRDASRAPRLDGAEVVEVAGYADGESMRRGFEGIDELLLVSAAESANRRAEHESAIDAAAAAGVARVVKLSGPDASADSPLVFERWHAAVEQHLAGSGLPAVLLRPRTYMTNLLAYARSVAQTGMLFAPAGTAAISFVDPRDVADVAAEALTRPHHDGATYTLTGPEAITFEHIAAQLAAATGRPVTYVGVSDGDARQAMIADGLPPMVADAIVAIFAAQRAGSMADTTDTIREITGRAPRDIAGFARDHAGAFRATVDVH
jgi:uncharacterized protein YbjT (DUF2867 family)